MKVTANFSLDEFTCKDGAPVPPACLADAQALILCLERIRAALGAPVRIVSGYRTPAYNERCGGSKKSQHLEAKAADITVAGVDPEVVHEKVLELIDAGEILEGGVGYYANRFVHYDIRGTRARWTG